MAKRRNDHYGTPPLDIWLNGGTFVYHIPGRGITRTFEIQSLEQRYSKLMILAFNEASRAINEIVQTINKSYFKIG